MGKISQINGVKLFVGGSASDESMALSAGIYLLDKLHKKNGRILVLKSFLKSQIYLGPSNSYIEENKSIKKLNKKKFNIYKIFS